jgi:hypothetical protein
MGPFGPLLTGSHGPDGVRSSVLLRRKSPTAHTTKSNRPLPSKKLAVPVAAPVPAWATNTEDPTPPEFRELADEQQWRARNRQRDPYIEMMQGEAEYYAGKVPSPFPVVTAAVPSKEVWPQSISQLALKLKAEYATIPESQQGTFAAFVRRRCLQYQSPDGESFTYKSVRGCLKSKADKDKGISRVK